MGVRKGFIYVVWCDNRFDVADEDGKKHDIQCQNRTAVKVDKHGGGRVTHEVPRLAQEHGYMRRVDTKEWYCPQCIKTFQQDPSKKVDMVGPEEEEDQEQVEKRAKAERDFSAGIDNPDNQIGAAEHESDGEEVPLADSDH